MVTEVERARAFAIRAHGDQRYGKHPYVKHLDDVAEIVGKHFPNGEHLVVLAYLHDVLEDTSITESDLRDEFGELVAEDCFDLTDPRGINRRRRKIHAHIKLATKASDRALIVKAADRLANVSACLSDGKTSMVDMYRDEHPEFTRAAFRIGLCDGIWMELDRLIAGGGK